MGQHGTTVTSPRLMAPARARGAIDHDPVGPHQMTTRATQRRRYRRLSRWELRQFANRRHKGTVSAIPACEINKSSGLAESNR
jgi:hypothetical protein